ncbi:hypothetical protein PMAYCL1PPCAC_03050, partial [Pristionchus mayeri]
MEEINRMRREKEEERRMQWNRIRNAFVELMRNRCAGMMTNETERQWDDRFNQLRRAFDPVREAFSDLESIPLRNPDFAPSVIEFEVHQESLRMSLNTLEEIMSTEHQQVESWKQQQPDAHFLIDLGSSLDRILSCATLVRREIKMVVDEIETNRENVERLELIFELRYLEDKMKELGDAVDSIPTVYDLNKKY